MAGHVTFDFPYSVVMCITLPGDASDTCAMGSLGCTLRAPTGSKKERKSSPCDELVHADLRR